MRIGLISDTHLPSLIRTPDQLGPQLAAFLGTVDLILHGGDVVRPSVLDWCEQFAPVVVARGNNDAFDDRRMAERQFLDIEGWRIGMVHELRPEDRPVPVLLADALNGERVDILIGGDTHVERLEYRDGVIVVNSGSPTLPHHKEFRLGTAGLLEISRDRVHAEIVHLGHSEGARNPSIPRHIEVRDGALVAHSFDGSPLAIPGPGR
ncbi:MAG: YfcE family phosphodiesterase [Dehalococcoidia bacterium]|nr:MAG: YfcE family phosphodiesterase [Dehalococcoidia bacterium]